MHPPIIRTLLRTIPSVAPVAHRSVLSITGSQVSEFLNGLLTSPVRDPRTGPSFSAFLHAQGRILYDVFLYTQPSGGYIIEYDSRQTTTAAPLLATLKRYVLRSKVKLRDVSDEYDVWAAWGPEEAEPERRWNWARSGCAEPAWDASEWPWGVEDGVIKDRRAVGMGKRRLVRKGDKPQESSTHDTLPSSAYTLHRVIHGVPEGIIDMPPMQAFPIDSNLDVMGALDFRKGCYVGQELTVRTYHTGMVRKRILPVVLHNQSESKQDLLSLPNYTFPSNLDIRANIVRAPNDHRPTPRPRGTGKLLTTTEEGVGLALLRLEHAEAEQRGEVRLEVDAGEGGMNEVKGNWSVSCWWPDWWPRHLGEDCR